MVKCMYTKTIKCRCIDVFEDEKCERQYMINMKVNDSGKVILIITNHPRRVNESFCNKIIKRVLKYLSLKINKKDIKEINIVNILSNYDITNKNLSDEENNKYILKAIKNADIIIAAWGKPLRKEALEFVDTIKSILKSIRNEMLLSSKRKVFLKVGDSSNFGYPKHVLAWKYDDELKNYFN